MLWSLKTSFRHWVRRKTENRKINRHTETLIKSPESLINWEVLPTLRTSSSPGVATALFPTAYSYFFPAWVHSPRLTPYFLPLTQQSVLKKVPLAYFTFFPTSKAPRTLTFTKLTSAPKVMIYIWKLILLNKGIGNSSLEAWHLTWSGQHVFRLRRLKVIPKKQTELSNCDYNATDSPQANMLRGFPQ